jgi:hypothetical protein
MRDLRSKRLMLDRYLVYCSSWAGRNPGSYATFCPMSQPLCRPRISSTDLSTNAAHRKSSICAISLLIFTWHNRLLASKLRLLACVSNGKLAFQTIRAELEKKKRHFHYLYTGQWLNQIGSARSAPENTVNEPRKTTLQMRVAS